MNQKNTVPLISAVIFAAIFTLMVQTSRSGSRFATANAEDLGNTHVVTEPARLADEAKPPPAGLGVGIEQPEITDALIRKGHWGRHLGGPMHPRYITIHSTQNWDAKADAEGHAELLLSGDLRSVSWHFTVDEASIYQSLPTNEQGRHSDFGGKGDHFSIGVEMCENWGNSREETIERTCHLVAWLMQEHDIPLNNIVPHQHWEMTRWDGVNMGHKNCPHFLMDEGKPGEKWQAFLSQIADVFIRSFDLETPAVAAEDAEITADELLGDDVVMADSL